VKPLTYPPPPLSQAEKVQQEADWDLRAKWRRDWAARRAAYNAEIRQLQEDYFKQNTLISFAYFEEVDGSHENDFDSGSEPLT
jgi:hypothetical protein